MVQVEELDVVQRVQLASYLRKGEIVEKGDKVLCRKHDNIHCEG